MEVESRVKVTDVTREEVTAPREMLKECRMDQSIPIGIFVELLAAVVQEYRLCKALMDNRYK